MTVGIVDEKAELSANPRKCRDRRRVAVNVAIQKNALRKFSRGRRELRRARGVRVAQSRENMSATPVMGERQEARSSSVIETRGRIDAENRRGRCQCAAELVLPSSHPVPTFPRKLRPEWRAVDSGEPVGVVISASLN